MEKLILKQVNSSICVPVYGFYKAYYMISKMTKAMQTRELISILPKLQKMKKTN